MTPIPFKYETPDAALEAIKAHIQPVAHETVSLDHAAGRVLASPVHADRPSPACDVSAMDGYGARLADFARESLPVDGETCPGHAPQALPEGWARRIFTGAPVPAEVEAIVRREDCIESSGAIALRITPEAIEAGRHIRRCGENAPEDAVLLKPTCLIDGAAVAALATAGVVQVPVYRGLKVALLVTGDELQPPEATPAPWQLRDSNGPALQALLAPYAWIETVTAERVRDDESVLVDAISRSLDAADVLLLSGGVSMGDYDHVPSALAQCGAHTIFHKLPIRPGKPLLAAMGPKHQLIFGLPGNPVSALVCARRFAVPAMLHQAGGAPSLSPKVCVTPPDQVTLSLHWFRLVQETGAGAVSLLSHRGSGDVAGLGRSSGFIEQPRDETLGAEAIYYSWSHL